jgi:hypothetical protein
MKRSSGSYKRHDGFNSMQVKNGFIVRLNKDGSVRQYYDRKTKEPISSKQVQLSVNKK